MWERRVELIQAFRCAAVTRREATGAIWWIRATHLAGGP